jgi:hypothetical protein
MTDAPIHRWFGYDRPSVEAQTVSPRLREERATLDIVSCEASALAAPV